MLLHRPPAARNALRVRSGGSDLQEYDQDLEVLSVCLSVCLLVSTVCVSVCLFVSQYSLCVRLFVNQYSLCVCPSGCEPVQSVCLSVCLLTSTVCVCPSVC
jgi:hypothetical protein